MFVRIRHFSLVTVLPRPPPPTAPRSLLASTLPLALLPTLTLTDMALRFDLIPPRFPNGLPTFATRTASLVHDPASMVSFFATCSSILFSGCRLCCVLFRFGTASLQPICLALSYLGSLGHRKSRKEDQGLLCTWKRHRQQTFVRSRLLQTLATRSAALTANRVLTIKSRVLFPISTPRSPPYHWPAPLLFVFFAKPPGCRARPGS